MAGRPHRHRPRWPHRRDAERCGRADLRAHARRRRVRLGEVTIWNPPTRLAYLWHLRRDRNDATEVEIRFIAQGAAATRIEIEHRGWERLGSAAGQWRDQNRVGWDTLLPHFLAAIVKEE